MIISLFIRESGKLRFNPYIEAGNYSLAIDGHGFLVTAKRRAFGYIKGSGWHSSRF